MHVITELNAGGAEQMLVRIATDASGRDAPRQIVVSLMDEGIHGNALRSSGVALYSLGMRRNPLSLFPALFRLVRLMRRLKPDVVMSWLYHADLMATLAAILSGTGADRLIWNLRCSDMDFAHYARTTRVIVALLARLSRLPAVVATNSAAGQRVHTRLGYRPKRWAYLPNGFDMREWRPDVADRAAVRSELGLADQDIAIGMVARVDPQKDHATFLSSAQALTARRQDLRFVLVGKDTDGLRLPEPLVGRLQALGQRNDVPRLMRGLDLIVLSSAFGEGFPNVVGEAMATGLPCIVTDVGDAAELVAQTGCVVPPRSPDALAKALAALSSEPIHQRALRGQMARERIERNYSIERVREVYREIWSYVARAS